MPRIQTRDGVELYVKQWGSGDRVLVVAASDTDSMNIVSVTFGGVALIQAVEADDTTNFDVFLERDDELFEKRLVIRNGSFAFGRNRVSDSLHKRLELW